MLICEKCEKQVMTTLLTMLPSGLLHQLLLQQLRNSFDIHLQLNYKRTNMPRDIVSPSYFSHQIQLY